MTWITLLLDTLRRGAILSARFLLSEPAGEGLRLSNPGQPADLHHMLGPGKDESLVLTHNDLFELPALIFGSSSSQELKTRLADAYLLPLLVYHLKSGTCSCCCASYPCIPTN